MFRLIPPLLMLLLAIPGWPVVPNSRWDEIDALHDEDRHEEVLALLEEIEPVAESDAERAALLWRRARAEFSRIDLALYAGEISESRALRELEAVQETASRSVELDPDSARGYFWRGAARAKRGELQGVLNALFMADDLRRDMELSAEAEPEYGNPYYVAGQLYHQVPGFPISFGDKVAAVSFSRRSVNLHESAREAGEVAIRYWDFYVKLAEHLLGRDWPQRRRRRHAEAILDDYRGAASPLDRGRYYEAVAELPERSDREEARELLDFVISGVSSKEELSLRDERSLEDARALLD